VFEANSNWDQKITLNFNDDKTTEKFAPNQMVVDLLSDNELVKNSKKNDT
jgi:hypothetical protein